MQSLRRALLGSIGSLAFATTAAAQGDGKVLDEIVVTTTGSNISGVKPPGSQAVTLSFEEIQSTGPTNITDVARTIPQIQTIGYYRQGNNVGVNSTGGSALNLRGLGPQATLLTLEGRRLPPSGTNTSFTESDFLPLTALQRIEVVPDASSAVYGSDAIAGVVNYILRRDLNGVEVTGSYTLNEFNDEWTVSALAGRTWDNLGGLGAGNLMVAYGHNERSRFVQGESQYLRQDLTPLGGPDQRVNGNTASVGIPGAIIVPRVGVNPTIPRAGLFNYYGLPTANNGVGVTAGQLRLNDPVLWDYADYSDYVGDQERNLLAFTLNQELTSNLEMFVVGTYSDRVTLTRGISSALVSLPASSPFYVTGVPGVAPGAPLSVRYNTYKDVGNTYQRNQSRNFAITTGLAADLPREWKGETYFTYGMVRDCGICRSDVNTVALQAQVTAGAINPLSNQPLSAAQVATYASTRIQRAVNKFQDFVVKANGPVFSLPGGQVRAAFGYENTRNAFALWGGINLGASNAFTINVPASEIERTVNSVFGEIFVPIVGPDMDVPLMQALNVNLAYRYDDYSDVGETDNPRFGVTWEVNDQLSFRGSWGTAFRAPGLPEKNPNVTSLVSGQNVVNRTGDPAIPVDNPSTGTVTAVVLQGAGPNLQPETATLWSAGFDYEPDQIPGLKISATYFNIDYKDQLIYYTAAAMLASPQARQLYTQYLTPVPARAGCVNGVPSTYPTQLTPFVNARNLSGVPPQDWCAVRVGIDTRAANGNATKEDGIDVQVYYARETGWGRFNLNAAVTHFLSGEQQLIEGGAFFNALDRINTVTTNYPVSWKGRGTLGWERGPFNAALSFNYSGSYENDQPLPVNGVAVNSTVDPYTTWDLFLSYAIPEDTSWTWARGTKASINILNVTDEDPQLVFSTVGAGGFGGGAFDGNVSNPYGRQFVFTVSKSF
jgi:iron complex outermembrane recepter protein